MKRQMLEILACPIDKAHPLELHDLRSDADSVIDGVLFCTSCSRFYPVIDEIPIMLPDELRNRDEDMQFLQRWKERLPNKIINSGKPWHL
ncbi:MAG: Trm112 family protein [Nitrososphaerales archaeon]